jgi:hypothetical protein
MRFIIYLLVIAAVVLAACNVKLLQQPVSRVAWFHYGGYGDTVYATLEGTIFYLDSSIKTKDSLTPLPGVQLTIPETGRTLLSDSNGVFVLQLPKTVVDLMLTKQGFQPLLIKNYVADPDQYASTKIYLEKGTAPQIFIIPNRVTE